MMLRLFFAPAAATLPDRVSRSVTFLPPPRISASFARRSDQVAGHAGSIGRPVTSASELPADVLALGVTGSTGGLGGMVARQLAELGSAQRLLVRDPARAPVLDGATPAV